MSAKSNYLENAVVNHVLGKALAGTTFTPPAGLFVGLATASTNIEAGFGGGFASELPATNGYARVAVTFRPSGGGTLPTTNGGVENNANLQWTTSGGGWSTFNVFFVSDSATVGGGNILYYGTFTSSFTLPTSGSTFTINAGELDIAED